MTPDLVLRSRRVVVGNAVGPAAVHVSGERIAAVTAFGDAPGTVEDLGELVLMAGLVDTHVHLNEPGRTDWEGFETGTRAAAAGGVTTLVDMPLNAVPPTTTLQGLRAKREAAQGKLQVDVALCGGVVPDNLRVLGQLRDAGAVAFKCFLCPSGVNEFPHVDEAALASALRELGAMGVPLFVHAELPGPLRDPAPGEDPRSYATWLASRPPEAEDEAVGALFRLCREHRARAHVVHLSSAGALPILENARAEDVALSAETCPHYLTFAAEDVPDGATSFKCAPPIRGSENRKRLWDALDNELLGTIASDHSPAPAALKCTDTGDFVRAWGGIASLQLGLAAVWTGARARGHGPEWLAARMCERTARLVGLEERKGRIAAGLDADLVAWDPEAAFEVDPATLHHRHPVTAYAGRTQYGRVERTWVRGRVVYDRGRPFPSPEGGLL